MSGNVQSSLAPKKSVSDINNDFMSSNNQYQYKGVPYNPNAGLSQKQNSDIARQGMYGQLKQQNSTGSTTPPPPAPNAPLSTAQKSLQDVGTGTAGAGSNTGMYQSWLANRANDVTPAQPAINTLQNISQNQSPEVQQATQNVKNAQLMQNDVANNPNVAAEVSVGRGQALTGLVNAQETGLQNALAGQGQQITAGQNAGQLGLLGQSQQLGAQEAGAGLGLTQQGQQVTALGNAGTLAQPITGPGGVLGTPQSVGAFGQGSNTAFGGGQVAQQVALGGDYTSGLATIQGAQNQLDTLSNLITSKNLNPNTVNLANQGLNTIKSNLSSSDYATLTNTLDTLGKSLGVDLVAQNTQEGGSLIQTIKNAIIAANAQNEAKKTVGQGGGSQNGANTYKSASGNSYNLPY